tara:strand:+ start:2765 stop:4693 length:1929 start_codon:yes stop_codon:yes gene_type:complete
MIFDDNSGSTYYAISCGVPSDGDLDVETNIGTDYYFNEPNDFILWGQYTSYPHVSSNSGTEYYFLNCNTDSDLDLDLQSNSGTAYYYSPEFNCVSFCGGATTLLNYNFTRGFPDELTHTRASGATVVDESGNVVWADENLISDSGNLDALLVLIGTPTPVPVVGGPSNEYHILRVNGGTGYRLYRKGLSNGTASGVHVILAKQGTARYLGFGSGDTYFNQFDWDTMTWNYNSSGCTGLAAVAHPEGDGWFYIALFIEYNGLNGISYLDINCSDATDSNFSLVSAVGTETVLVADTMRARKMAAPASFAHSDFFVTTGSTAYHAPRITHDAAGNALGYLHEPQVTNKWKLHRPLSTFTGINIQDPAATGSTLVEAASESNPSGGQGASLWTPADFSSRFYHYGISGAEQTMSAWIKAPSGAETFKFSSYNTTDSSDSSSVLAATGEWKRFQFTVTTTANGSFYIRDTSGPLLIWGFQVEEGTAATSLIPTYGAEATRQADACSLGTSLFAEKWNETEGTLIFEGSIQAKNGSGRFIMSQTSGRRWCYANSPSNNVILRAYDNTTVSALTPSIASPFKLALALDSNNNMRSSGNGESVITTAHDGRLLTGGTNLFLYENHGGIISRFRYLGKALPDAKLITLTT